MTNTDPAITITAEEVERTANDLSAWLSGFEAAKGDDSGHTYPVTHAVSVLYECAEKKRKPMTNETEQAELLIAHGWKEIAGGWLYPQSTMHNPIPLCDALKIDNIIFNLWSNEDDS